MRAWVHRGQGEMQDDAGLDLAPEAPLQDPPHRDPVTGLHSRLWADHALREMFSEAMRYRRSITVAACAVDRLDDLAAQHGAAARDALLVAVGGALARGVRSTDAVARWTGDEFLLCLADADAGGACLVVERARRRVASLSVACGDGSPLRPTLSVGWATAVAEGSSGALARLVRDAEAALRSARRAGPDRAVGACASVPRDARQRS